MITKTKDDVDRLLNETSRLLWTIYWDLKPSVVRLLTKEQEQQIHDLHIALHEASMKLLTEEKPKGWRKGQRVTVAKDIVTIRDIAPKTGTKGIVDRVMQNEYGWWVCVSFTGDVEDLDGIIWELGDDPAVIWFKPDELQKGWSKTDTK